MSVEEFKILINPELLVFLYYNNCMERGHNLSIFLQDFYKGQEILCIGHQIRANPHYLILTSSLMVPVKHGKFQK